MKNLISKKRINNIILGIALLAIFGLGSCESNSYVNPQEYLDDELELLNEFYGIDKDYGWLDSMSAVAIDTVDRRQATGMMLFHTKIGEGDSIKIYKKVGFRYKQYQILTDTLDQPGLYYYGSNEFLPSPTVYTTFLISDATSAYSTGVPQGVNEAILRMRNGGEARVVVPSTINANISYITTVYDLKITYLEE